MRIGLRLGGPEIELLALTENGRELLRQRAPAPADYDAVVAAVVQLVAAAEAELGSPACVGVATPGAVSPLSGAMERSSLPWLEGRKLKSDLQQKLAREVRVANDANCFALSEAVDGAARRAACVFGVLLGTGVGGAIVARGHLRHDLDASTREWGHRPMPFVRAAEDGPAQACYCGHRGCIETYLSAGALARDCAGRGGAELEPDAIAARAASGDTACEASLAHYEDLLARAFAQVINIVQPDVIVLGGRIAELDRLYANVPKLWQHYVFSGRVSTRLEKNLHGVASRTRGAAWLWD
ncbi:MAG: ROK family protein [Rhodocyclaceae bacterium]|nr:ROK family protein [Rhodocyclaceae bacterium]MBX3669506.1 ROK family protein [Rhodocyclaceae bacterium]